MVWVLPIIEGRVLICQSLIVHRWVLVDDFSFAILQHLLFVYKNMHSVCKTKTSFHCDDKKNVLQNVLKEHMATTVLTDVMAVSTTHVMDMKETVHMVVN